MGKLYLLEYEMMVLKPAESYAIYGMGIIAVRGKNWMSFMEYRTYNR